MAIWRFGTSLWKCSRCELQMVCHTCLPLKIDSLPSLGYCAEREREPNDDDVGVNDGGYGSCSANCSSWRASERVSVITGFDERKQMDMLIDLSTHWQRHSAAHRAGGQQRSSAISLYPSQQATHREQQTESQGSKGIARPEM